MITVLIILLIIFCVAIGLFVLIQNPKGGGLATGGSGSNMFGVQRTGDVLEKGTWVLLALIVVCSLAITAVGKSGTGVGGAESKLQKQIDATATPPPVGNGAASSTTTPPPANTGDTTKK